MVYGLKGLVEVTVNGKVYRHGSEAAAMDHEATAGVGSSARTSSNRSVCNMVTTVTSVTRSHWRLSRGRDAGAKLYVLSLRFPQASLVVAAAISWTRRR